MYSNPMRAILSHVKQDERVQIRINEIYSNLELLDHNAHLLGAQK